MTLLIPDLNSLAAEIHQQNVDAGWWDEHLPDNKADRYEDAMMLVVTELSEATEGARKDLMDDKLPAEKMFDVEMADAMIRLLDLAGAYKVDLDFVEGAVPNARAAMKYFKTPLQHIRCAVRMSCLARKENAITSTIEAVIAIADTYDVDLWRLVAEKRAFNRTRKDHTREARAAEGGKKW
jgi:hypothetical protein